MCVIVYVRARVTSKKRAHSVVGSSVNVGTLVAVVGDSVVGLMVGGSVGGWLGGNVGGGVGGSVGGSEGVGVGDGVGL